MLNLRKKLETKIENSGHLGVLDKDNSIIYNSFLWLSVIFFISFLTGYIIYSQNIVISIVSVIISSLVGLGIIIAISFLYEKISYFILGIMLILFSILEGIGISYIFFAYTMESIIKIGIVSVILFSSMGIYGYITKRDLTKLGNFLLYGLIVIILFSLINIFFFHSTIVNTIINVFGILIFLGLTAFDLQMLKNMKDSGEKKFEIIFGLSLFLNLINIFTSLLQLFGEKNILED